MSLHLGLMKAWVLSQTVGILLDTWCYWSIFKCLITNSLLLQIPIGAHLFNSECFGARYLYNGVNYTIRRKSPLKQNAYENKIIKAYATYQFKENSERDLRTKKLIDIIGRWSKLISFPDIKNKEKKCKLV